MGRGYRVLMLAAGTDTIDLLVTQTVPAGGGTPGSVEVPASALFGAGGSARMGVVLPDIGETRAALGPAARFELRPQRWKALPFISSNGDTPSGEGTPSGGGKP